MATQILNVIVDGVTDIPRLPGQSAREWDGSPPDTTRMDVYSVYHSQAGDDLIATARLTGENWQIKYFRIAGDDHHTTIQDLDGGADRRIELLVLGYNSDVDLISTRVQHIVGWDGDKHDVKLGDQQKTDGSGNSTFSVQLNARENIVETGNAWVNSISTGWYGQGNATGDTIIISSGGAGSVLTGRGNDKVTTTDGFVSTINTGDGSDKVFTGSGFVESISTGDGNDTVNLGDGIVGQVLMGDGNDKLIVKEMAPDGGVKATGWNGTDTILFSSFSKSVTFSLATTEFQNIAGNKGNVQQSSFENVTGGKKGDNLTGDATANVLSGKNGNDKLWGKDGRDTLKGDAGNDRLLGQNGADDLRGGKGKDVLEGGRGNDTLRGNQGEDVFVFGKLSGTDTVKDYQDNIDTLRLVGHTGGFSDLTISNQSGDKVVVHDNGTIILEGRAGITLTATDFDFV